MSNDRLGRAMDEALQRMKAGSPIEVELERLAGIARRTPRPAKPETAANRNAKAALARLKR